MFEDIGFGKTQQIVVEEAPPQQNNPAAQQTKERELVEEKIIEPNQYIKHIEKLEGVVESLLSQIDILKNLHAQEVESYKEEIRNLEKEKKTDALRVKKLWQTNERRVKMLKQMHELQTQQIPSSQFTQLSQNQELQKLQSIKRVTMIQNEQFTAQDSENPKQAKVANDSPAPEIQNPSMIMQQ